MALSIHAADLAAAVVEIVIAGKFAVFGGNPHGFGIGKVLFHVSPRTEQALFFAAPEPDADGAVELQVESLQNAHHLDHDGAARAVIGSARAGMPGVEVSADHHDLAGFAASRNFADDVQAVHVAVRSSG